MSTDELPASSIPRSLEQAEREAALRTFRHPADLLERERSESHDAQRVQEVFGCLLLACIPPIRSVGCDDAALANWRRMIALVYVAAPGIFDDMPKDAVAARYGIDLNAWNEQLAAARVALAYQPPSRGALRTTGPFQAPLLTEVPPGATPSPSDPCFC